MGLASELHVRGRGDRERGRLATKISTIHAQSLALQLHLVGRRRPRKVRDREAFPAETRRCGRPNPVRL